MEATQLNNRIPSVFELTDDLQALYEYIEEIGGEINEENKDVYEWLEKNKELATQKATNIYSLMSHLEKESDYLDVLIGRFKDKQKKMNNTVSNLKGLLSILTKHYGNVSHKSKAKEKPIVWQIPFIHGENNILTLTNSFSFKGNVKITKSEIMSDILRFKDAVVITPNFKIKAENVIKPESFNEIKEFIKTKVDKNGLYSELIIDEYVDSMFDVNLGLTEAKKMFERGELTEQEYEQIRSTNFSVK